MQEPKEIPKLTQDEIDAINKANHCDDLWGGDSSCVHETKSGHGGGIVCVKCGAWFCY